MWTHLWTWNYTCVISSGKSTEIKTKTISCSVHKSYKTRKWTSLCIENFEENMDLSRIYLAVHITDCTSPGFLDFPPALFQERIGNIVTCKGWGHCSFSSSFLMLIKMMEASTHVHEYIDPGLIKILIVITMFHELLLLRENISIKSGLNYKYLVHKNQHKNLKK